MRLKYRILWFEDDDDVIEDTFRPVLNKFLESLGFELDLVHHPNGNKLKELLKDRNLDLIVTDLNLGDSDTGKQLIEAIRDGHVQTEVLLYSANAQDLENALRGNGWVERVSFHAGVATLDNKVTDLIGLTIRKHQDVNNIRGLVIAETIDLEIKIEKILLTFFESVGSENLDVAKKEILNNIHIRKEEQHKKDLESMKGIDFTQIRSLIEKDILTAANTFDALHGILKSKIAAYNKYLNSGKIRQDIRVALEASVADMKALKGELNLFRDEILKIRNTLAHVKEEIDHDGIPFLNSLNNEGTKIKFDSTKYREIRKNLHKHNENLDRVLKHVNESLDAF
jgi:CheY-like chemotaxis protein